MGTQRTETIYGYDKQDLYWGVRAANFPGGADWTVRSFRLEPDVYLPLVVLDYPIQEPVTPTLEVVR